SLIVALFMQLTLQAGVFAQSDVGRLTGTVRDQNNSVVPGATVTIKNEKTGEERTLTTGENGLYQVSNLKPAYYTITVIATGFAKIEYTQVQLSVGQELVLDVDLKPKTVTEEITITGNQEAAIDVSSARIGANVNEREVAGLPINGRQ